MTNPTPTLVGSLADNTGGPVFTLSPVSTAVGEVMLQIGRADSLTVTAPPVISGGGTVTWALVPPIGNVQESGVSRQFYHFWGHGTFDGSDVTIDFTAGNGSAATECTAFMVDWVNTKPGHPFGKLFYYPLPAGNTTSIDVYQMRRSHANNALGGFVFDGKAQQTHTYSEGTILAQLAPPGFILTCSSFWKASDFTNFKLTVSWATLSSNGAYIYEVFSPDSDTGPTANVNRKCVDWADNSGDILTPAFSPKPNEVIIFKALTERVGSSTDFTTVQDSVGGTYSKIDAFNVDADHRMHVWACRYGATPASGITIQTSGLSHTGALGNVLGLLKQDGSGLAGTTNTDWLVQAVHSTVVASSSITGTLTGVKLHSAILAFLGRDSATADWTMEQGWAFASSRNTDGHLGAANSTATAADLAVWLAGDEDPTFTGTVGGASDLGIVMLEVIGDPAALSVGHGTDAILKKVATKTQQVDAFIVSPGQKIHTTLAVVKKTLTRAHTTDTVIALAPAPTLTMQTDAVIEAAIGSPFEPFIGPTDLAALIGETVSDNDLITEIALDSACQAVRSYIGQTINFVPDDAEKLDGRDRLSLRLSQRPVRSVSKVVVDGIELDPSGWDLRKSFIRRVDGGTFTLGFSNVVVTYSHGWDIDEVGNPLRVPADIRLVALLIARRIYVAVGSQVQPVQSETIGSYSYSNATAIAVSTAAELLPAEKQVLDAYKIVETI